MQHKGKLAAERKSDRAGHYGRLKALSNNGMGPVPEHLIVKATDTSAEVRMRLDPDGYLVLLRGRQNVVLRLDHEASERLVDVAQHLIWGTPKAATRAKARRQAAVTPKDNEQ